MALDLSPPPQIWLPPKPAIIRPAEQHLLSQGFLPADRYERRAALAELIHSGRISKKDAANAFVVKLPVKRSPRSAMLIVNQLYGFHARRLTTTDPYFANVLLLVGFEGTDGATTTTDESTYGRTATFAGNAQIDTADKPFGTSSLLVDGTGDYVTFPDSTDWGFSGQFTVEGHFKIDNTAGTTEMAIVAHRTISTNLAWRLTATPAATPGLTFALSTDGSSDNVIASISQAGLFSKGTWYHLAADRDSSDKLRLYLGGVMKASDTTAAGTAFNIASALGIGASANGGIALKGWLKDIRITGGVARYANDGGFSAPTTAFPRS